jgi:threonine/homoserine/homoserine lactone efflux protein
MNSLIGIGVTSFLVALSGALMPGPLLTTTVGESSRHGAQTGPLLIAGHAILELLLVVALFLGLAPLLTNKNVTAGIGIAGSAVLVWLAVGMFRSLPSLTMKNGTISDAGRGRLIASGILVSLSNPYWSIWWATIGLTYILQSRQWGFIGVVIFFIGHLAADFSWYSLVSFSIGRGRRFFNDTLYRGVVGFCALFLVLFAVWFLFGGIKKVIL